SLPSSLYLAPLPHDSLSRYLLPPDTVIRPRSSFWVGSPKSAPKNTWGPDIPLIWVVLGSRFISIPVITLLSLILWSVSHIPDIPLISCISPSSSVIIGIGLPLLFIILLLHFFRIFCVFWLRQASGHTSDRSALLASVLE